MATAAGIVRGRGRPADRGERRDGYHRDELYFWPAGRHLAWRYPDQPPLTPALARLVGSVAPDSLVALRLPSALMAAGVVLTGMIARGLGGRRAERLLAAACMAVAGVLLGVAHLLGTTTIDLLAWVAVCWVGARILRGGDPRWWLAAGAILGVALLNKSLIAVLPVALLVGVLISGPRRVLTTRWFPLCVALAVVIVAPNLWWQAANGWPEVALSSAIAAGGSGTSEAWWLFLPYLPFGPSSRGGPSCSTRGDRIPRPGSRALVRRKRRYSGAARTRARSTAP